MQNNPLKRKMAYLCGMYNKILCLAFVFALALSVMAEDLQSVIKFYKPDMSKGFIFVSKVDMTLTLVNSRGKVVVTYPIACGMNIGQKRVKGDHRTPEGYFLLEKIHDSSNWGHDFHDGKGFIKHAYGHYFLRLQSGFQGIGIHGTHAPSSIGTRATEGCIRLYNDDIEALGQKVTVGMPVIIGPEEGVSKLIASNAQRPDLPYWTTGGSRPAKPASTHVAQKRRPKVVDGELDIDPEQDLVETAVETPAQKAASKPVNKATSKPAEKAVAAKPVKSEAPVQTTASKQVEKAEPVGTMVKKPAKGPVFVKHDEKSTEAETPVVETPKVETTVVETPKVETPVVETPKVENPVVETPVVETPKVETSVVETPIVDKPVESTDQAPQYEVVVEEVIQPDGTVKYEVRYVKK